MGQVRKLGVRLAALAAAFLCLRADMAADLEYRVKAAYLLNFARFVEWPPETSVAASTFTICVIGDDPFGPDLDQVVQGELVESRKIVVQRSPRVPQDRCDVAFISKTAKLPARYLEALGPGVLTVGEGDQFLRDGGMIAFVLDNRRVRFDVNHTAARNGSVRLSSRLLSVARSVEK